MIKKPFFGLKKPELKYCLESFPFEDIPASREAILFLKKLNGKSEEKLLKVGDNVKTGQKIKAFPDSPEYVISPVTGKISSIFPYTDALGQAYEGIKIESDRNDDWDDQFTGEATLETAIDFLEFAPGKFSFRKFSDVTKKVDTIIINGMDVDLGITVNQEIVRTNSSRIKEGIDFLKKITGVSNFIIAVPENLSKEANRTGATVKTVSATFPDALPEMIIKNTLGKVVPAGQKPEDIGVAVISAESTAAVGEAFATGKVPVIKALSVVGKNGKVINVKARIGTPIGDILSKYNVAPEENDRIILGGPMMGTATYSKDLPIEPNTEAITVQSESDSAQVSDYPCISCGECVRICPVRIPVNFLCRFAEFGFYEDAERYDLNSCIECGLCAYVCTARRPLLQYIKLAKHELELIKLSEAVNE
ncbi:MAG: 4Fe-4S dicluster domain-containing protein [Proteobacteria bacterium]|nr:4Fe-4S dicluster domain-containing protein [Pseudomonadota bacterium]